MRSPGGSAGGSSGPASRGDPAPDSDADTGAAAETSGARLAGPGSGAQARPTIHANSWRRTMAPELITAGPRPTRSLDTPRPRGLHACVRMDQSPAGATATADPPTDPDERLAHLRGALRLTGAGVELAADIAED